MESHGRIPNGGFLAIPHAGRSFCFVMEKKRSILSSDLPPSMSKKLNTEKLSFGVQDT